MLFLAGASYEDYEKVKLTWRHPPNAAVSIFVFFHSTHNLHQLKKA